MQSNRYRTVAGVSLVAVGTLVVLAFITAQVLYPDYSAADQTISAMGADGAPPESQLVFNGSVIVAGILTVIAAASLYGVYERRWLSVLLGITGFFGFVGLGAFPAQTGTPHLAAAGFAFVGAGVSAVALAYVVREPFRYVSVALGLLELVVLLNFLVFKDSTPLGIGGLERWVAYLGLIWVTAFGGFLLAGDDDSG